MRALALAGLMAGSLLLSPLTHADSIDGSDGYDGSDGTDGTDGADGADGSGHDHGDDDDDDEEEEKGCSHVGRLATPVTGLSIVLGGALLVGARRQD